MTDEFSLLCAIADAGADDVPRLMYADWLEEFAPERAPLARHIRACVRVARGGVAKKPTYYDDGEGKSARARYYAQRAEFEAACVTKKDTAKDARRLCRVVHGTGLDQWLHEWYEQDWDRGLPYRYVLQHPLDDHPLDDGLSWRAVGPVIVRRAPVSLFVSGRTPYGLISGEYVWLRKNAPQDPRLRLDSRLRFTTDATLRCATLPEYIFDRLPPGAENSDGRAVYFSATLAVDALSRAAILWARATDPETRPEPIHARARPAPAAPAPA